MLAPKASNRTRLDEDLAEIGAQPNSFAPAAAQSTTITWTGTPVPQYTATIKTSGGTTVRTLTNTLPSATVTWDGKDTGGAIQPPGTYTATLSAAGQTDQTVTITLTRQATATYSYDTLYRLTQATNPWAPQWTPTTRWAIA
ncbi:MAG: FlgD immunoglobulin-like domain containing protein [Chloroflexota bacterium]